MNTHPQAGYTHLMYALHALAGFIGVTSSATVVGAFVFGIPSIIAILMNYARRDSVRGSWLESHFQWQARTFWTAAVAMPPPRRSSQNAARLGTRRDRDVAASFRAPGGVSLAPCRLASARC